MGTSFTTMPSFFRDGRCCVVRALALGFAFAQSGGRDALPIDRATYGRTIDTLHRAMAARAKVDQSDKVDALKRPSRFATSTEPT